MKAKVFAYMTVILATVLLTAGISEARPVQASKAAVRQQVQKQKIKQGVHTGALTKGEVKYLKAEQKKIKVTKKVFKLDGRIGPVEKRILDKMQDQASRDIFRLKHNRSHY
jgi:cytochrome c556